MTGIVPAFVGVLCAVVAGFVRGQVRLSNDPELPWAAHYGLLACAAFLLLVGGVSVGMQVGSSSRR